MEGREVIIETLFGALGHVDTTHSVGNPRVAFEGDTAHLDALVEA
ncbi:nuclear transport factor 2 family protein, partial [Pseudomonas sp.]